MTSATSIHRNRQTIFFDATCGICSRSVRRLAKWLAADEFEFVPLQSPLAARLLDQSATQIAGEIKLCVGDGRVIGGADAIIYLCRRIWWAWPIWLVARLPGVMRLLRPLYPSSGAKIATA